MCGLSRLHIVMSHLYKQKKVFWLAYYRRGKLFRESLKTKHHPTAKYLQSKKDQELVEGKYTSLDTLTISLLDEYDETTKHRKTKATHYRDIQNIKRYLAWSKIQKVKDISEKSLQDYFNHLITDKKALATVNRNMASIKTFLRFAIQRKHIFENPTVNIKPYRSLVNPPRCLTKDEIQLILKHAKKTDLYPAVVTAAYTGMRKSELFQLEWSDIDLLQNTVTIRNKEGFTTKSKKFRVIPLHPTLKALLGRLKRKTGPCFDTVNQRRVFGRIVRQAKLKDVGWHTLRHSFASNLVINNVDIVTISKLLGHSNIATTQIYLHVKPDHLQEAVQKLRYSY